MKLSLLAVIFIIFAVILSGILTVLTLECGILSVCFLLGGLTEGPPALNPPGSMRGL
jgi:hypothetical protein